MIEQANATYLLMAERGLGVKLDENAIRILELLCGLETPDGRRLDIRFTAPAIAWFLSSRVTVNGSESVPTAIHLPDLVSYGEAAPPNEEQQFGWNPGIDVKRLDD